MEKLKNIINPGSQKDDEVMYGSGRSDDPVHSGNLNTSGQGSQSGDTRTAAHDPLASTTNPSSGITGSGLDSTSRGPTSTSTNPTGGSQYDSGVRGQGTHGLNEPYASRMPGGFDDDDAASTASVRSGVPGQTTHTGSGMTGTHDPSFTNKPLPHEPGTTSSGLTGSGGHGTTGGSTLTGNTYPDRTAQGLGDRSNEPSRLDRDAGLGAGAVGAGALGAGAAAHHHHHKKEQPQNTNYAPETGRSFPLGGNSNTTAGTSHSSGRSSPYPASGAIGSTTAGPHSSNLANKADPRVDSDLDRSRRTDNTSYGAGSGHSGAHPVGGAVGSTTAGPHSSGLANKADPRTDSDLDGSNTGRGVGNPSSHTGTYPAGGAIGSSTAGPHSSNLANKADPRVDSDLDGSRNVGNTGYGSGTGATPSAAHQGSLSRDVAPGVGTGAAAGGLASGVSGHGPESWQHDHKKHGHQYAGDPCAHGETSASGPHFIQGPHATDTANLLDPHVAIGSGSLESAPGTHGKHGHGHVKEDAALSGIGGSSLGTSEGSRDPRGTTSGVTGTGLGSSTTPSSNTAGSNRSGLDSSPAPTSNTADSTGSGPGSSSGPAPHTAGPHKSDMLNKMDPRVDSDLSKQKGTTGTGLGSSTTGSSDPYGSQMTSRDHGHSGTLAAVGGAGLAGAAASGDRTHHHGNEPIGTASGLGSSNQYSGSEVDPRVDSGRSGLRDTAGSTATGRDHHLGRDATTGAGAGGVAYEAEKHLGKPTQSSTVPSHSSGSAYDNTRGPSGYDKAGSQLAGSSQQPATTRDHHLGRDATLGAGAGAGVGGLAYEAGKHHGRDQPGLASTPQDHLAGSGHQPQSMLPGQHSTGGVLGDRGPTGPSHTDYGSSSREHNHPGAAASTYPSSGYGNERNTQDLTRHGHHGTEAAGAGLGAGALGTHEQSRHDRNIQDTQDPGHYSHRKEEALAGGAAAGGLAHHDANKDQKALEKEHAKEIKEHEKAIAKEEKKHEKHHDKHEKAHEKDEKKHGGLLGFLHRDKHDKDSKEHKGAETASHARPGEDVPAGTVSQTSADPLAREHGSQSGVHEPPLGGSGITTHDAYGTNEGHNKLHKDPPGKVLEARGQDYQGHSNAS